MLVGKLVVKKLRKDSVMLRKQLDWKFRLSREDNTKINIVTKCKRKDKIKLDLKHRLSL